MHLTYNTPRPTTHHRFMSIFALHNLEEVLFIQRDMERNKDKLEALGVHPGWYRRDRMALATAMLTAAAHLASRNADNPRTGTQAALSATVAGALGGNALSHLIRAAIQRSYNGGAATSLLMLPAAGDTLHQLVSAGHLTHRQATIAVIAGNIVTFPLIFASLTIAKKLLK